MTDLRDTPWVPFLLTTPRTVIQLALCPVCGYALGREHPAQMGGRSVHARCLPRGYDPPKGSV